MTGEQTDRIGGDRLVELDRRHVWHPYSSMHPAFPVYGVKSADGVRLRLTDGRELVDGMSSWWSAIHGYNHPKLNMAVKLQLRDMAHVMFGGLTHRPAVELAEKLVSLTPAGLETVFFADSGSVSVEVALKMAVQYQAAAGRPDRKRFISLRRGYHGDTLGAMSVCDPDTGMHSLFSGLLPEQVFVDAPSAGFTDDCSEADMLPMQEALERHADEIAAVILEPVVQGAGGMRFYSPAYLRHVRDLCKVHDVLLVSDEIATGFGRTGKLFACEHAGISPDILCLGKALTGGYMTLAATLTTARVAEAIAAGDPGILMHGPTFMANPLACAVANASIELLLGSPWQSRIHNIETGLAAGLAPCRSMPHVRDVRVLGAIGVVELEESVDMQTVQPAFVERGVWVRPFGRLVYLMPPFIINADDLEKLTTAVVSVVDSLAP
jgi:adenosylmethionine-8-amino-7-oxononanoate aminotransferase